MFYCSFVYILWNSNYILMVNGKLLKNETASLDEGFGKAFFCNDAYRSLAIETLDAVGDSVPERFVLFGDPRKSLEAAARAFNDELACRDLSSPSVEISGNGAVDDTYSIDVGEYMDDMLWS